MQPRSVEELPLIGESPAFMEVLERVSKVAPLNRPVLIIGERGTGKELIASRLHYLSSRWEQTLVTLNCAALAESLLESELFGHESGSFTGASKRRAGRFELADRGTLFLDELANTSLGVQEKILRVIEYGVFERVGGDRSIRCDVRLIGATNEDLPTLAEQGKFRADLLDRLAFDVITLPPLRHRREDIDPLATHFARAMTGELGREVFSGFSPEATEKLNNYSWPGNVRELKNVVERAVYRLEDPDQTINDIDFDPFASPYRPGHPSKPSEAEVQAMPDSAIDFKQHISDYEIRLLKSAMKQNRFNQRKTADFLGLTYHQLRGYLRKYELLDG